jgi:hypothetical protein
VVRHNAFLPFDAHAPREFTMTEIPQTVLLARRMYDERKTVRATQAASGLSLDQLYRALDGLPQPDGSTLLPPIPRRRIIVRKASRAATRVALVTRLMRAAELQLHGIEQRLASAGYEPTESDRNSRAIALLARTMRELTGLDERNGSRSRSNESSGEDGEPVALDIEELRRSLTRKLDALVAEQQGTLHRVPDGS